MALDLTFYSRIINLIVTFIPSITLAKYFKYKLYEGNKIFWSFSPIH